MRASPDLEWRIIIIDTNVVSELMRASPDPAVDHGADILFLTAVSEGELRTGAASCAQVRLACPPGSVGIASSAPIVSALCPLFVVDRQSTLGS